MKRGVKFFATILFLSIIGIFTTSIYAQNINQGDFRFPFLDQVSQKLGIDSEELYSVVSEVREENRLNMIDQKNENILDAFEKNLITEREFEIIQELRELRGSGNGFFGKLDEMSYEEIESIKNDMRNQRGMSMLDMLNEKGFDITHEEMSELREKMDDLGLMGQGQMYRGGGGFGGGRNR